jgi:hypothetical protein
MNNTKNDLSFNHAKLDLQALIFTAKVALGELVRNIDNYNRRLIECASYKEDDTVGIYLNAEWANDESKKLLKVAECLATLNGCLEREEIEIIK